VSSEAIQRNLRTGTIASAQYRDWKPPEVLSGITDLLSKKDLVRYHGGPFWDIGVVIHTDEVTITSAMYVPLVGSASFGPFKQVTFAFLIFPREDGTAPYVRLRIRRSWWSWIRRAWLRLGRG